MATRLFLMCGCILQVLAPFLLKSQASGPRPYTQKEAYVVYSTILQNKWALIPKDSKRFLINGQTYPFPICFKPAEETAALIGPAMASYSEANKERWTLNPQFRLETPWELMTSGDMNNDSVGGSPTITFSAIGFNKKKTVAIIAVRYGSSGTFVILRKDAGKWQLFEKYKGGWCTWAA